MTILTAAVEAADPPRTWLWASWTHCDTCAMAETGTTRGWADTTYAGEDYDPIEWCREQGHDVSAGAGLFREQDAATAAAIESWWEAQAHAEETTRRLDAGDIVVARAHARRARSLAVQYNDFTYWRISPTPPASTESEAEPAATR
ncbi:MAG: hypothetical protein JWN95_1372 [Frankiales bacterium]|nr:hypothetical protein [Frankiales bacterium]